MPLVSVSSGPLSQGTVTRCLSGPGTAGAQHVGNTRTSCASTARYLLQAGSSPVSLAPGKEQKSQGVTGCSHPLPRLKVTSMCGCTTPSGRTLPAAQPLGTTGDPDGFHSSPAPGERVVPSPDPSQGPIPHPQPGSPCLAGSWLPQRADVSVPGPHLSPLMRQSEARPPPCLARWIHSSPDINPSTSLHSWLPIPSGVMEAARAARAPRDILHGVGGGHGDGEQAEVPGDCREAARSARGWTLS